jgi:leader peptidase (prepilin peptidase) / N-methyltransferase
LFDKASTTGEGTRFVARTAALVLGSSAHRPRFVVTYGAWGAAAVCLVIASLAAAPGIPGLVGGGLAVTMIAIAAIDARSFTIPDKLVLVGLVLGFVNVAVAHDDQLITGFVNAALRGGVLMLLFFGARLAYRLIRKRQGIGLGDVKLAAVAGVWLDWVSISVAVDVAALSALAAVLILAVRGRRVTGTSAIPFGLFFAPAIWLAWLLQAVVSD